PISYVNAAWGPDYIQVGAIVGDCASGESNLLGVSHLEADLRRPGHGIAAAHVTVSDREWAFTFFDKALGQNVFGNDHIVGGDFAVIGVPVEAVSLVICTGDPGNRLVVHGIRVESCGGPDVVRAFRSTPVVVVRGDVCPKGIQRLTFARTPHAVVIGNNILHS